jgi:hypothetical protein
MLFGIRKIVFHRWGIEVVKSKKVREYKGKPIYMDESFLINIWRPFLNLYKIMTSTKGRETLVVKYPRDLRVWAISGHVSDEKTTEQREQEKKEKFEKEAAVKRALEAAAKHAEIRKDIDNTHEQLRDLLKKESKNG